MKLLHIYTLHYCICSKSPGNSVRLTLLINIPALSCFARELLFFNIFTMISIFIIKMKRQLPRKF